ncbi:SecY-interacting protein [Motiliproteus sp. SC1-56]|uniref:SecY-interacting protein n=1 Tax=Motiliproteus sp. SC1-56 TaxID=2799565 RepID=UPI001A8ED616|nr:SecY-interacting protein [Motiliproteus sp. SC1-56]
MSTPLEHALDNFIERFIEAQQTATGALPQIEFDPEWPSPCYQGTAGAGNKVAWKPVRQQTPHPLFDGLATALETEIHPDLRAYYQRYWSDPIPARCAEGDLSLLFLWNEEDYERLRGNLVGHALAKKKQRQPLTLFFACTEPEDYVLSLDNTSGVVLLEQPGRKPLREVAGSLTDFIQRLEPRTLTD